MNNLIGAVLIAGCGAVGVWGIEWTGPDGQPRETLVNALNVYRSGRARPNERMLATIQAKVDRLRAWAAEAQ